MKQWQEKKVSMGAAAVVVVVALVGGLLLGNHWQGIVDNFGVYLGLRRPVESLDFSEVNALYRELVREFDGVIEPSSAIEGVKRGLVASAGDRYTVFMNAEEAREFDAALSGDIGAGVGIELGTRDGYVRVLRTLEGNPAREAGIQAGDIIYKVDGEEVWSMTPEQIANRVRGPEGTEVHLVLVRGQDEVEFTITRERINNVSAYVEYDGDVATIVISRFDSQTGRIVSEIAQEIINRDIDNVIVDLRGNGGGYVNAVRDVLSLWVDDRLIMDQRSLSGFNNQRYLTARNRAVLARRNTVVLINGSSASAAEIMAGALQDYELATVIGEQSFGKGSVQVLRNLSRGNRLKVTIARWYTPLGQNIDADGITPDIEVERTFEDINAFRDPQLERAKQYLRD